MFRGCVDFFVYEQINIESEENWDVGQFIYIKILLKYIFKRWKKENFDNYLRLEFLRGKYFIRLFLVYLIKLKFFLIFKQR